VERDVEDSLRSHRGSSNAGLPLSYSFASHGWAHEPVADLLDQAVPAVDVLYLSGSMEASGGTPAISVQGQTYAYESAWNAPTHAESLTTTMLDRFLRASAAANGLAPVVVLDVSLPKTPSEAVRQVHLRNDFAHQVMTLGHAPTILATGSGPVDPQDLVAVLDEAARFGWTAVELLARARKQHVREAAPALFSAAPVDRFPVIATVRGGPGPADDAAGGP
jgi:hypothetical protein